MHKSLISKFFILLLVVGLLFAVAPTRQAQAAAVVNNETELRTALAGSETTIELGASFALAARVDVNRSVTIDGKGFTITGPTANVTNNHAINVAANNVTIQNLTITGTSYGHNLQFYSVTGGVVTNVTLSNGGKSGMTVNGSEVTITDVTTTNNAWGGINVDQGGGVTEIPLLTVTNVTTHTSPVAGVTAAIWVDKGNPAWVSVGDLYTVVSAPNGYLVFYANTEFATIAADFPVHNETLDIYYANLQQAVAASAAGDIIKVYGTYVLDSVVTLDKAITLTCASGAKIQVSGAGDRFDVKAAATISNCEIEKTDKTGEQNIIRLNNANATGAKILDNKIHGQWVVGDSEVSRAIVVNAGNLTGVEISGNEIYNLRQPAYISGDHTGTISNNYIHDTKGWVLEGGNFTFTGNTWANNVGDIAILLQCPAAYYTDIVAMSAANNGAVIEDQRMSPALLSAVYVDDSSAAGGNGTQALPLQTIQAGIARVVAGGTIHVAAGTYDLGAILAINKAVTIIGEDKATTFVKPTASLGYLFTVNSGGALNLSNFTIDGEGFASSGAIRLNDGATGTIDNNVIKNFIKPGYQGFGIVDYGNNAVISNNTFSNIGRVGMWIGGTGVQVTGNTYTGKGTGDWLDYGIEVGFGGSATITGNTISNCLGVASTDGSASAAVIVTSLYGTGGTSATLTGNTFSDSSYGIMGGYDETDSSIMTATGNTFTNIPISVTLSNLAIMDLNTTLTANTFPAGSAVVGNNIMIPPPVHNTTQDTYFYTIQAAINAADANDAITVAAGTYLENITVNKTLTLTGAGRDLVTIQGSNLAQDGVFNVTADDVTVEGFTIKGAGYKTVRVSGVNNRLTFKNNKVIAAANTTKANGWSAFETDYNQLCTGHVVTGNIFVGNGTAQLVYYNHNTGITFTGNTFEGTTVDNMNYGPVLGFDGLDGTQTISGNTFNVKRSGGDFRYSVYALIETFGTYDLEAIRAANIFQYDGVAQDTVVFKNKIRPAYQYNSTNDLNKAKQTPGHIGENAYYVELVGVSIPDGTITLRYVNPTAYGGGFEYRRDGEDAPNLDTPHYNPWIPDYLHRGVYLPAGTTESIRTYDVDEYIEVRATYGPERDFDFDWTRFEFVGEILVDDSFTGTEEGFGVRKFSSLQAAIDAALPYATIRVAAGTYSDGGSDGYNINKEHLTLILEDGVIIQNTSPCFTIEQSYTSILSEENLGAVCVPTNGSNAIEVLAGLKNIIIKGIYFNTDQGGEAQAVINFQGAIEDVQILDNYFHVYSNVVLDGIVFKAAPTGIVEIKGNLFVMDGLVGCAVNNFFGNPAAPIDASFNSFSSIDGHRVPTPPVNCTNVTYTPFTNVDLYLESSGTPWLNQEINGQKFTLTVKGDLQNVAGAIFTLHYDPARVDLDETTLTNLSGFLGAAGGNIFTVDETLGTITFAGEKYPAASGAGLGLFSAEFTALQTGPAPFTLSSGREHFTMVPGYGTSSNIYYYELLPVTVDVIALPTINTTDIQGYYLEGEQRQFSVVLDNPSTGADYDHVYVDFEIANARVAQIEKIEYSVEGSPWIEIGTAGSGTSISDGPTNNVIGYFGKITGGGFSLAAGQQKETLFRVTFKTREQGVDDYPTSYLVTMQLRDADSAPTGQLLDDFTDTMLVYDKPIITIETDPYFIVNEPGQFAVTIENPATGRPYGNNIVFDVVIPDHVVGDFESMSCGFGTTTWPVTLESDGAGGVKARILGLDTEGRFDIGAPFGPMTVTCTATLKTAGEYLPSWSMVDMTLDPAERIVQTGDGSMTAYTKPTIVPTFPAVIDAGVPVIVPVVITNPGGLEDPFELVLTVPAGTAVTVDGVPVTCTGTTCVIVVDPTAYPVTLNIGFTFPAAGTPDIGFALIDRAWKGNVGEDRTLAEYTAADLPVGGNYSFTGTVSMQGNLNRAGVPVIFDLVSEFDPAYVRTFTTVNTISGNLTGTLTYGGDYLITTNQPRYLNVIAANNRLLSLPLAVGKTMNPLELKAGNAIYTDNIINNLDSGHVGSGYIGGIANYPDADVNFDNKINIQDLALVGGNYMLDHTVYDSWVVVTP